MLRTWDLPSTLAFYTKVLGCQCDVLDAHCNWIPPKGIGKLNLGCWGLGDIGI